LTGLLFVSHKNNDTQNISGHRYNDSALGQAHSYILPSVLRILDVLSLEGTERRLFDLGCGNGSVAATLTKHGWDVTGVDPSETGIAQARKSYPDLNLFQASAYDDLAARFGQFPVVISLEVVEHVYFPRQFTATLHSLLEGGVQPSFPHPTMAT
jgi:2-polyprenyl-6-hydroxyphenyl methylase/3-demethylubiquinone-9 3-methyltransferase